MPEIQQEGWEMTAVNPTRRIATPVDPPNQSGFEFASDPYRFEPDDDPRLKRIAVVGNYVPRQCGIATFTADIVRGIASVTPETDVFVVAVNDTAQGYAYPERVRYEIQEGDRTTYAAAGGYLNRLNVDAVCLQHEFGIFGGPVGSHLLTLLEQIRMPVVTTLHTVLRNANNEQKEVMRQLALLSDRFIVMSQQASSLLSRQYGIDRERIDLIHHGIPNVPFGNPDLNKPFVGLADRTVLLTFGLVGPGKGLEHALGAMPAIIERHPDVVYAIVGATHPKLRRDEGERYRENLHQLVAELGLEDHVVFHNRFLDGNELRTFLTAADIYLTPYPNLDQSCSGTLAYAVGAGNAVVSTPYRHARELLDGERGVLVPPGDSEALGRAVIRLLADPKERHRMRERAYRYGRQMTWPAVSRRYVEALARARDNREVSRLVGNG